MPRAPYDPAASAPMSAIVRVAVMVVTAALFVASSFNAMIGERDIAVMLALAAPLGISAWGFARAGHNEAAIVLLCLVLLTAATVILMINPLGFYHVARTMYGGVMLVGAFLLSRRAFLGIALVTLIGASAAFFADYTGLSPSLIAPYGGWPQYVQFVLVTAVFALLGRVAAEQLFGSLGDAHHASLEDPVTGLHNRTSFFAAARTALSEAKASGAAATLVVADLEGFKRVNQAVGHEAGDRLLHEAGRRITDAAHGHLLARLGDDEFAVLAVGVPDEHAAPFARDIHAALAFDLHGVAIRNAAGYARFPRDAHAIEPLLLAAEASLAAAQLRTDERLAGPGDRI